MPFNICPDAGPGSLQCRYYLRSLGANPRKEPSNVQAAFPELAADLHLPQPPASHSFFSSVLRISSGEPTNMCRTACLRSQMAACMTCHISTDNVLYCSEAFP